MPCQFPFFAGRRPDRPCAFTGNSPITTAEATYGPALLERAESLLLSYVPTVLVWAETDDDYRAAVVSTEADMLARLYRNPAGIVSETEGLYTYRLDLAVSSGRLNPTDDELYRLRRLSRVGSSIGGLDAYARRRYAVTDAHRFLTGG